MSQFLLDVISERGFLIAPFKGESKELFELAMVELTHSLVAADRADYPDALRAVARCPLVRGLLSQGVDAFVRNRMQTFDNEKDMEAWAAEHHTKVAGAIVFRT